MTSSFDALKARNGILTHCTAALAKWTVRCVCVCTCVSVGYIAKRMTGNRALPSAARCSRVLESSRKAFGFVVGKMAVCREWVGLALAGEAVRYRL